LSFLIDTCVLSEGPKPRINSRVVRWLDATSDLLRYVSVLSLAELQYGILRMTDGRRKLHYATWYDTILRPLFGTRVLPFDESAALIWAQLRAIDPNAKTVDSQLAATALRHDLTLVTRNVKDFAFAGLRVINPWQE